MSTKAIVIHTNEAVQEWVGSLKPEWDVQVPVPSASEVWDYLGDGRLSGESEVVFISDLLYSETPEDFAVVVASFAQSALIIITVEDESLRPEIEQAVAAAVIKYDLTQGPYYFFDTAEQDPAGAIDGILNVHAQHLAAVEAAEEVAASQPAPAPAVPSISSPPVEEYAPASSNEGLPRPTASSNSDYTPEEMAQISNNLGELGLIVASTSSKGGSGKTTTAMCTAITISMGARIAAEQGIAGAQPLKVCVVDMDVRDGQIGFSINQTTPSILTLYVNEDLSIESIQKHIISVPRFEIDCLLAPKRGRTADYLTPQFYLDVLHKLRLMYDLIIMDTSVAYLDPLLSQVVYPESDAILLVTNLSKGAVLGMPRWMDEVTSSEDGAAGVPKEKIGVVINQSLGGVGMDLELVKKAAKGAPLLVAIPADNRAVTKASNDGTLNDLIRKHETIGAEYFKLASKVWRKTPLSSPLEEYLNSKEKQRDDDLASRGKTDGSSVVSTFTPLSKADAPVKKSLFGRSNKD